MHHTTHARYEPRQSFPNRSRPPSGLHLEEGGLHDAPHRDAVQHVCPKAMIFSVSIAGLVAFLWRQGAEADVMKRFATPLIGGVVSSTLMELAVYPGFSSADGRAVSRICPRQFLFAQRPNRER